MNSQPTSNDREEQEQRLKQIRERLSLLGSHYPSGGDRRTAELRESMEDGRFLISLLDHREIEAQRLTVLLEDFGTLYSKPLSHEHADVLWTGAATAMRNKCIERVRALRHKSEPDDSRWNVALYHAETQIQSLTLDQVEMKR